MCIEEQRTLAEPIEELEEIILNELKPERTTRMGTLVSQSIRRALASFLKMNQDVFAWSHDDMPGIDHLVIVHRLNLNPTYYPNWLANVVMVKKANGKWRMCVDFTNLNRACPKDSYPLLRIDTLVDSTVRHELLSFMEAFLGYNQIKMNEDDQERTSFVTS